MQALYSMAHTYIHRHITSSLLWLGNRLETSWSLIPGIPCSLWHWTTQIFVAMPLPVGIACSRTVFSKKTRNRTPLTLYVLLENSAHGCVRGISHQTCWCIWGRMHKERGVSEGLFDLGKCCGGGFTPLEGVRWTLGVHKVYCLDHTHFLWLYPRFNMACHV